MFSHLAPLKQTKGAKYRQITEHLRNLINTGKLEAGTRLPTALEMAEEWKTNHFTIHLALTPLVKEGLIERQRRRGTFVRDQSTQIASVAIYFGGNLWQADNIFYQVVYQYLEEFYQKRNGRSVLFVDRRPTQKSSVPLPELQKAIDQREVQGVIGLMLSGQEVEWLRKLQVPVSIFGSYGIRTDRMAVFELALARLAADGCRSVGMIWYRLEREWHTVFQSVANRYGMEVHPSWIPEEDHRGLAPEFSGYHLFKDLWAGPKHPEGLLVYPDVSCRGAIVAAMELGLCIPQDLRLVFHRNAGTDYLCPWKIPFIVTDIRDVAQKLVDYLDAQYRRDPMPPPIIDSKLIDGQMLGYRLDS